MTNESAVGGESGRAYGWDFFLAHAGPDLEVARGLKEKLEPPARAFLDAVNINLGDDWDQSLSEAQRASLISVVILSPNTTRAYYQREEIAAAIQMAREDPDSHRVVPVFVGAKQLTPAEIPYGLRLKHGLSVRDPGDFPAACERLLETLRMMKHYEVKKEAVVAQYQKAIPRITGDDASAGRLAGLGEVTRFVRPLLWTLLVLFILMAALLVVCLLLPAFADVRGLLAAAFGGMCALLLAAMLWLVARSLKHAQQIALGRINGG